jgi:hypothetical protein
MLNHGCHHRRIVAPRSTATRTGRPPSRRD